MAQLRKERGASEWQTVDSYFPPPVPAVSSIAAWPCEGEGGGPSPRRLVFHRIKDAAAAATTAAAASLPLACQLQRVAWRGFISSEFQKNEKTQFTLLFALCTHTYIITVFILQ